MLDEEHPLALAAVDAATARRLEEHQAETAEREQRSEQTTTWARDQLALLFPDLEPELTLEPDEYGQPVAFTTIAGARLHIPHRGRVRALVTCPLCDRYDRPTMPLEDLADFGALFLGPVPLEPHTTPTGAPRCDGLRMAEPQDEREMFRVDEAHSPEDLYKKLNLANEEGYRPTILQGERGWVIVGRRIGNRYNKNLDAFDDDEPF